MRKILSSFIFISVFTAYAIFHVHAYSSSTLGDTVSSLAPTPVVTTNAPTSTPRNTSERHATLTPTVKEPVASAKTPTHISRIRKGPYVDGTYTGPLADAYYERIQVRVIIKNGVITKVSFLPFQIYNGTSQAITSYAMPRLRLEALSVQKANVNNISGATEISNAFRASLSDALLKAV